MDQDTPERRLHALGIELPKARRPVTPLALMCRHAPGGLLFVSGHAPVGYDGKVIFGKVGRELDAAAAAAAARLTGLNMLASVRRELGTLDRVRGVLNLHAMVNVAPGFVELTAVMDACSSLFIDVFGEAGKHARSTVGMAELPSNIVIEIEGVLAVV